MTKFLRAMQHNDTLTENNAPSNSTTGDVLVDQFAKSGAHRGRDIEVVFGEMSLLWQKSPLLALRFIFYLRLITRVIKGLWFSEKLQRGQGNRDESFKRMLWLAKYQPKVFYDNMWLIPVIGSWKDLWELMSYDIIYGTQAFFPPNHKSMPTAMNRTMVYKLILDSGLKNNDVTDLVRKYIPRVRSSKTATTDRAKAMLTLAKEFMSFLKIKPKQYRALKAEGKAHLWQQQITKGLFDYIRFDLISGKALLKLVSSKFLAKHNLENKYLEWVSKQKTVKFTGYAFELGAKVSFQLSRIAKLTINKQFETLVELGLKDNGAIQGNVFVAVDSSSSMNAHVAGGTTTAMNVAQSLGVYFARLIKGAFANHAIIFSARSKLIKLQGEFTDMYTQLHTGLMPANTDFLSIIREIARVKYENPDIPESEFPETVLVVSDMQFDDPAHGRPQPLQSTYQAARQILAASFSQEYIDKFKFIWWVVNASYKDFPQTIDQPGGYVVSGFDGAIISALLGGNAKDTSSKPTMEQAVQLALDQEVLQQLTIAGALDFSDLEARPDFVMPEPTGLTGTEMSE